MKARDGNRALHGKDEHGDTDRDLDHTKLKFHKPVSQEERGPPQSASRPQEGGREGGETPAP